MTLAWTSQSLCSCVKGSQLELLKGLKSGPLAFDAYSTVAFAA